jgi:hypothetical protein
MTFASADNPWFILILCVAGAGALLCMAVGIGKMYGLEDSPPMMEISQMQREYMRQVRQRSMAMLYNQAHSSRRYAPKSQTIENYSFKDIADQLFSNTTNLYSITEWRTWLAAEAHRCTAR